MSVRKILVVGATGKQGGAVVKALLASPPPFDHKILALTRNTEAAAAKKLAENPKVELVKGTLSNCAAIFEATGGSGSIWGVFLVTVPSMKKGEGGLETQQGNDLVDAAVDNGVEHLVFSSVDRKGDASDNDPTKIPHFISKHEIEVHLKEKAQETNITWTILRPVAFMENMAPNLFGKMFGAMWANMGDTKLQLVATKDIGIFATKAFANPDSPEFKNKSISLAGDDLNQAEAAAIFLKTMGRPMPQTFGFLGDFLQYMITEVGTMFQWFVDVGYGADINGCKKMNPGMLDFETWLKQESAFKK